MNEWIYILLGFFAGIVFAILFIVSIFKGLFVRMIDMEKESNDE